MEGGRARTWKLKKRRTKGNERKERAVSDVDKQDQEQPQNETTKLKLEVEAKETSDDAPGWQPRWGFSG